MADTQQMHTTEADVSRAMVALHKEQFGRGPTKARTSFAGPDAMMTVLEDAALPAEKALVAMGESPRVQEIRRLLHEATKDRFIRSVEELTYRKVRSFQSTFDPPAGILVEISIFEPREADRDGTGGRFLTAAAELSA
jgi:uncharacterized protein YbcI